MMRKISFQMKTMGTLQDFLDSQFPYQTRQTKMKVSCVLRTKTKQEPRYLILST